MAITTFFKIFNPLAKYKFNSLKLKSERILMNTPYTFFLKSTPLFNGFSEEELTEALTCLNFSKRHYAKGELILRAGSIAKKMGIVLSGSVTIENNDIWGNRVILSHVGVGQLFAETYALLSDEPMLVDAAANADCDILFLNLSRLGMLEKEAKGWASRLTLNLLMICAGKNLALSDRSFHTSPKTIRGRVMSYLNSVAMKMHSDEFDIPFDRQQLAGYLNTERSALSKELGKMQRDGLIIVKKNHFILSSCCDHAE